MIQRFALVSTMVCVVASGCVEAERPPPAAPTAAALPAPPPPAPPAAAPAPVVAKEVPITSKSPAAVEAFEKARELVENARGPEAVELIRQAIQPIRIFASAHAMLGTVTPGPEAMTHLEKALALSKNIPEPKPVAAKPSDQPATSKKP